MALKDNELRTALKAAGIIWESSNGKIAPKITVAELEARIMSTAVDAAKALSDLNKLLAHLRIKFQDQPAQRIIVPAGEER